MNRLSSVGNSTAPVRQQVSFCRICSGGCGTVVDIGADEKIIAVKGDKNNPLTKGYACFKGLNAHEAHSHPDRLLTAMKKGPDGRHFPIPTEQALDEIAEKLSAVMELGGPDAVGAFCGNGSMPNATAYPMVRSFVAALGSSQYYSTMTIDQSAKMISFGRLGGWAGGQRELDQMDALLMFGANPLLTHAASGLLAYNPVRELKQAKDNGLKLITIDPRQTETSFFADLALQPLPGQDAAICAGMMRMILGEGWEDADFCSRFVGAERMDVLTQAVEPFTPDMVEQRAGLGSGQLRTLTEMFARDSRTGFAYASTGPNMTAFSNLAQHMVELLNVVCGRFPRSGERVRRSNVQAPAAPSREQVIAPTRPWEAGGPGRIRGAAQFFGEKLSGTLADEILTPGPGQLKALVIAGGNPATSLPNQIKAVKALESLELLVTIDPWMSPTARLADYIFAPTMQYEQIGLSLDIPGYNFWPGGWAQYTPRIVPAPQGSDLVDDWYVFWALARRLGKAVDYAGRGPLPLDRAPTADEVLAHKLRGAQVSLEDLQHHAHGFDFAEDLGVILPTPDGPTDKFDVMPPDVAAELRAFTEATGGGAPPSGNKWEFPFLMVTRRMRDLFNSSGITLPSVRKRTPTNPAWFNGEDMSALGFAEGDLVRIRSAVGEVTLVAARDDKLRAGCVQTSHGWGSMPGDKDDPQDNGVCINLLIDDESAEDINSMPFFSGVPVEVTPLPNHPALL